jgi:HK97 gp10 family phage protein
VAKFYVGRGIDQYIEQLTNLEFTAHDAIGRAIYMGADVVADAIRANIQKLPATVVTNVQRQGLLGSLGIASMRQDGGEFNVKIGFDGYNAHVTKKYPKGHPNSMIARAIESGTSFSPKHPFVDPAVRATKDKAEKAMAEELNKELQKRMG